MARKRNSPKKSRKTNAAKSSVEDLGSSRKSSEASAMVLGNPVENGRPEYQLGPVFVPNKLMNGTHSCTSVRARPYPDPASNQTRINASLTGLLKRESGNESCRSSRGEMPSQFSKTHSTKLPREELKCLQKESFLPKIDKPSKTNLSLHSVSSFHQRSPSDCETFKLPPARKLQPGNVICRQNPPSTGKNSPSSSGAAVSSPNTESFAPKPPSLPKARPSRNPRRTR